MIRTLRTVRLSITTECDLDCAFCNSDGETVRMDRTTAVRIAHASWLAGARLLRLTGGDPLSHPELTDIIAESARAPEAGEIAVTTSGRRLAPLAVQLREVGLSRVNIGLSSLDPDTYRRLTGADLAPARAGIDAALDAGLGPVKINVVLTRGLNDGEIPSFVELARTRPVEVRFIERMPFDQAQDKPVESSDDVGCAGGAGAGIRTERVLEEIAALVGGDIGSGSESSTATVYTPAGFAGRIGTISPLSEPFCARCDRLRVTAAGFARPCLARPDGIDLTQALRNGLDARALAVTLGEAFSGKPECHGGRFHGAMRSIGG